MTKLDTRVKGHVQMLDSLKAHVSLGQLLCGVIPANEEVAYAHQQHLSVFEYDPGCAASRAYAQFVGILAKRVVVQERV